MGSDHTGPLRSEFGCAIIAATLILLGACSGDETIDATDQSSTRATSTGTATAYIQKCGGCHGALGSDQATESLPNVASLSTDLIEAKIRDGGPQMPAFGRSLSDAEINALANYVADNS